MLNPLQESYVFFAQKHFSFSFQGVAFVDLPFKICGEHEASMEAWPTLLDSITSASKAPGKRRSRSTKSEWPQSSKLLLLPKHQH